MYKNKPAGNKTETAILKELQIQPKSFAELLEAVDVSSPTARRALKKLEDNGWVTPLGTRESTGGRPASVYGLNPEAAVVVGVHLELPRIHFVITNLTGDVLQHEVVSRDYDLNANEAIQQIIRFIRKADAEPGQARITGVSIASPGYLDNSGTILAIGRDPAWRTVPLATRLQQETNLPVLVSNDVDCMAQAEIALEKGTALDDFLYLGFTEGVKASLVLNGQFYGGPFGNAGSIGHTTVAPDGPWCTCGNRGCLEAVASVRAVHMAFEQRLNDDAAAKKRLSHVVQIEDRMERFTAILKAAADGDAICQETISQILYYLAIAVANLVNIFQVKLVIIGGSLSQLPPSLRLDLDGAVRNRLVHLLRDNLTIRYAADNREHNAAVGAAQRFIREYLETLVEREEN